MDRENRSAIDEIAGFDALSFSDSLLASPKKDTVIGNVLERFRKKERRIHNRWSYDHIKKQKVKLA